MPERNASLGQIIRRHFNIHLVAGQNADAVFAHFSRGVRQNLMTIVKFHAKHGIGQDFRNNPFKGKKIFFGHFELSTIRPAKKMPLFKAFVKKKAVFLGLLGCLAAQTFNLRPAGAQFFLKPLIAAIKMVDSVESRLPFRRQSRQSQRNRSS